MTTEKATTLTEKYFRDWFIFTFPYGYGSGEEPIIEALKAFFGAMEVRGGPGTGESLLARYDFQKLEKTIGAATTWLLINVLSRRRNSVIEYGTSPRYGWLTEAGLLIKGYMEARSTDTLLQIICQDDNDNDCEPGRGFCYCSGREEKHECNNPLF